MSQFGVVADPKWGTCVHGYSPPAICDKCPLELRIEALDEAIRAALDVTVGWDQIWSGGQPTAEQKIERLSAILNRALEAEVTAWQGGDHRLPTTSLTDNQVNYLLALSNHRLREIQRTVDNFAPRFEQTPEDAAEMLARFQRTLKFRTGVVATLTRLLAERGLTPSRPFGGKSSEQTP